MLESSESFWNPRDDAMGLLDSLFRRAPSPAPKAGQQIAMPLFADVEPIAPEAIVAQWASSFPRQPPLKLLGREENVLQFLVGPRTLFATHVPVAIPGGEAEGCVQTSWMWQRPDDPIRSHRAHAIVTTTADGDSVHEAWDVTRLSVALLHAGQGAALYWGSSRQVHLPELARDFAAEEETPPIPLWVGITISGASREGPFSATTHGLEALGHKELEVLDTRMALGDLREALFDIAFYVFREGPVLEDGQTFGPSAEVKWKIRHRASKLVPGRGVISFGIP